MDKILLKDIKLYGYHGVLPKEQEIGQYFHIDVELSVDLTKAGMTDELTNTVDYTKIYDIIVSVNKNNKFRLIETFAHNISREILSTYEIIKDITVQVRKPDAPIDGDFAWMGVEIKRSRENA